MRFRNPFPLVLVAIVAVFLPCAGVALAQQPAEYRGTLEPKLVAHVPPWYLLTKLRAATDEERGRVKVNLATGDRAFVTDLASLVKGVDLKAALVERAGGQYALLVDFDRDGVWAEAERVSLVPSKDPEESPGTVETAFDVPLPAGYAHAFYPLVMKVRPPQPGQANAMPTLLQSSGVAAQGVVDIDGRKTIVRYTKVNLRTGAIDAMSGWLEVDCNGDGAIDTIWYSPENSFSEGAAVVFRVGSRYVSTTSVDASTRIIVMRTHPASDYQRIELQISASIPDFAFVDFDGKPRKLSDFRGKYLMLDFWGSWCGPCISRFPALKDVYAKYRTRGFEILGMDKENWEGDQVAPVIEKAKAVISEKALAWPQARPDSVKTVIDRFHIVPYPTYVLLDKDGRVVSWGQKGQLPLDGPELATTLEKVLSKAPGGRR